MIDSIPFGDMYLEQKVDEQGKITYQLSKPSIYWRFTVEQLESEIVKLREQLKETKELLDIVKSWS
jgi:hypothetical protein